MRLLILSEIIKSSQSYGDKIYSPPYGVQLDVADLNEPDSFTATVFDHDVSIVHIKEPSHHTLGYYENIPKLLKDTSIALQNGRSIIVLPHSGDFRPKSLNQYGPPIYDWLSAFRVQLQENYGEDIRPSGVGRSEAFKEYLRNVPNYFQIVKQPYVEPEKRIAVVGETDIVVGSEQEFANGFLVILPPPLLDASNYQLSLSNLVQVSSRYYERAQRRVPISDSPDWLGKYLVSRAKGLNDQISDLNNEKETYDRISYILYGTGEDLEDSVAFLLEQLGLEVYRQPSGSNLDLKVEYKKLKLGFAIEVTGTKGTIQKDSKKIPQAWQFLSERKGTPEEDYRMIVVANTEYHLDPQERKKESFSSNVVELLGNNSVLLITTRQLYDLWRSLHEGKKKAEDIIKQMHSSSGLFKG